MVAKFKLSAVGGLTAELLQCGDELLESFDDVELFTAHPAAGVELLEMYLHAHWKLVIAGKPGGRRWDQVECSCALSFFDLPRQGAASVVVAAAVCKEVSEC
jgi:hypothetical protein